VTVLKRRLRGAKETRQSEGGREKAKVKECGNDVKSVLFLATAIHGSTQLVRTGSSTQGPTLFKLRWV
jgi:hypothetical protein